MAWHEGDPIPADHKDDCKPLCEMCSATVSQRFEIIMSYDNRTELKDFITDSAKKLAEPEAVDWRALELEIGFDREGLQAFVAFGAKFLVETKGLRWQAAIDKGMAPLWQA